MVSFVPTGFSIDIIVEPKDNLFSRNIKAKIRKLAPAQRIRVKKSISKRLSSSFHTDTKRKSTKPIDLSKGLSASYIKQALLTTAVTQAAKDNLISESLLNTSNKVSNYPAFQKDIELAAASISEEDVNNLIRSNSSLAPFLSAKGEISLSLVRKNPEGFLSALDQNTIDNVLSSSLKEVAPVFIKNAKLSKKINSVIAKDFDFLMISDSLGNPKKSFIALNAGNYVFKNDDLDYNFNYNSNTKNIDIKIILKKAAITRFYTIASKKISEAVFKGYSDTIDNITKANELEKLLALGYSTETTPLVYSLSSKGFNPVFNFFIPLKITSSASNDPNLNNENLGQFISKIQLSALVQQRLKDKMPIGPVGGRITRPDILTRRTDRFLKSVTISYLNYTKKIIKYFYNPIYTAHVPTARNPDVLIENSIREIVVARVGQRLANNTILRDIS